MISSLYSRARLSEKEDPRMWSLAKEFMAEFETLCKPCGGIRCSAIARVDWTDRKAVKRYYNNPDGTRATCIRLVGEAAFVLGRLLEREKDE